MNSDWCLAVKGCVAVVAAGLVAGCVDVNGGAVELSWAIVNAEDGALSRCREPSMKWTLTTVQLHGRRLDCSGPADCECISPPAWDCDVGHGSTSFEFAEGRWELGISVGTAGTAPRTRVPDPIVRDIAEGQVAQLDALLVLVEQGQGDAGADAGAPAAVCGN